MSGTIANQSRFGTTMEITATHRIPAVREPRQVTVDTGADEVAPKAERSAGTDTSRRLLILYNSGSVDALICYGDAVATSTRWTTKLKANTELREFVETKVTAITASGSTTIQVTEVL